MSEDHKRVGPEELPDANCNGHVGVERRKPQWRNEDQHNGNAASPEGQRVECPVYHLCNGVDSTDFNEPDTETVGRGARRREVTERQLSVGLEEGELEQSILEDEEEEKADCLYRRQESMRNGESARRMDAESCVPFFES